jgi:bacterioferritin-associated ferredoxin
MYVCICNAVTEREIRQCAELGASSLADLRKGLGVATSCGKCKAAAVEILREERSGNSCIRQLQAA